MKRAMRHSSSARQAAVLFCLLVAAGAAAGENLLRNASFESPARDVMVSGFNRYGTLRQRSETLLLGLPLDRRSGRDAALDDLEGGEPKPAGGELGWRLAHQKKGAAHGDYFLACDIADSIGFGVEVEAGTYTFSVAVRGGEEEMIKLRVQDIRGQKGEIRNDYERAFKVGATWTRCAVTTRVYAGPITCFVETLGKGRVEVDALQLEAGEKPTEFQPHPWDRTPPAEIADKAAPLHPATVQRVPVRFVEEVLSGIAPAPAGATGKATQEGRIALRVSLPPRGVAFPLPCSGGVPLPRGALFDERCVRLLDAADAEVPCQTRVLSRNVLDGSIQMLLLDLVAPAADARFTLHYGPEVRRKDAPQPLAVTESPEGIEVTTGPLRFRVRKSAFNLVDALWFDADGDGRFGEAEQAVQPAADAGPWTHDPAGRMYWGSLGRVESVRVEEAGPVRCCIAASGTHRSASGQELFRYVVRLHAYAGKPWLRVEHLFSNEQQPYSTIMTGAGVRLALKPGLFREFRLDDRATCAVKPGETAYVVEGVGGRHWQGEKTRVLRAENKGLATLVAPAMCLTAAIREWDWMPPKEFTFSGNGAFDLCVWPRHITSGLAVPRGVARSHRLWLRFDRAEPAAPDRAAWLDFVQGECLVEADRAAYCDSTAFGKLSTQDEESFPVFERFLRPTGDAVPGRFPRPGEYRWSDFITYGDDRGDGGWANMETMLDHCMWLLYVRSLDPWYFRRAADAAIHYRDVDLCHPWGQARVHCHNHTVVPWDGSHDWIKGVLDHYLLTGDGRSLESANEYGRWVRSLPADYKVREGSRRFTRLVQNLADLYRITGHRQYLENFTARIDCAEALRGEHKGVSRFDLGKLFSRKDPAAPPESSHGRIGFMQYYGIYGLMDMAEATGDARWKELFLEEAAFIVGDGEKGVPHRTIEEFVAWGKVRGQAVRSGRDRMCYPPLGYAWQLTGDERWKQALLHAVFSETTRPAAAEAWPSLGYADQVLTAHGVYWAQRDGQGPDFEATMRGEAKASLRDTLRDADFEEPRINAWIPGGEAFVLQNMRRIAVVKDATAKRGGERSLLIDVPGLTGENKDLDRGFRKRPLSLSRNYLVLKDPGFYELAGYVRFFKHDRPDVALVLNGLTTEKRRDVALNLPALLPKPQYEGMLGLHSAGPTMTADGEPVTEAARTARVAEDLDGPRAKENPDDYWWRFACPFEVMEPTRVTVILLDHLGLIAPGKVWFDEFSVRKLDAKPAKPGVAEVRRDEKAGATEPRKAP
jgi:hypothetical protein